MKKTKPVSRETRELLDAMTEDANKGPSEDKLKAIRAEIALLRDDEMEKAALEERLTNVNISINNRKFKTLVDKFDEVGVTSLGIDADGNMPPYLVQVEPYYKANIAEDWEEEKKKKAFDWLAKNKHGDLVKRIYSVQFGRGEEKQAKAFEAMLKKSKISFASKLGVPWNTLTAFVREQIEVKKVTPPLDILGATVGRVAKVVKQKERK